MSRGGRALRSLVVVAVSVAGTAAAWAAKLDKIACAELSNELNSIKSTGVKADMERGPAWAMANMPPERLESVRRLLELEDQLEFRCAMRGIAKQKDKPDGPGAPAAPAKDEAPASRAAEKPPPHTVPAAPSDKRTTAPAMLAPVIQPPVALKPTHAAPTAPSQNTATVPPAAPPAAVAPVVAPASAPSTAPAATASTGPASTAPGTAPAVAKPVQPAPVVAATPPAAAAPATPTPVTTTAPVTKSGPLPSAAAAAVSPTTAQPAPSGAVPAAKKPGDPATATARKKNPRRNPSSAYVSPGDVNPFSLPGMGSR